MDEIRFNLSVYAVPVVPGRPGAGERLAVAGDALPAVPDPFGPLCECGVRGKHTHASRRPRRAERKIMIRKVLAALALLAALLTATLVASTPALAVGSCSNGWICFWNTSSSTTAIRKMDAADTSPGECHTLDSAATSYVTNRSGSRFLLYTNGICNSWPAGTLYAETDGSIGSPWNNNARSYKRG